MYIYPYYELGKPLIFFSVCSNLSAKRYLVFDSLYIIKKLYPPPKIQREQPPGFQLTMGLTRRFVAVGIIELNKKNLV